MQRRKNASLYDQELKGVLKPYVPNGYYHVYNQYTIQVIDLDRSKFQRELLKFGIETKVYYPLSLNKLPYLKSKLNFNHAEICSSRVLSLPIRPNLKNSELERVIKAVNKIAEYGT
jgi:dTDP-4-amino-4,6-dideoxygalactose transaminase